MRLLADFFFPRILFLCEHSLEAVGLAALEVQRCAFELGYVSGDEDMFGVGT
jgi:hypothetical protein